MKGIFIPLNVPSSKNSKQWTGKMLIHSKTTRNYIKNSKKDYIHGKEEFDTLLNTQAGIEPSYPIHIDMYFIRSSKRKFDYINPAQTVQDLMVKWGWIEDDNCDIIVPHFSGYHVDKENPGVIIKIL
jgi:Holliday junction resolvase RusA-like endonuclease